jgi:hypothetical protein
MAFTPSPLAVLLQPFVAGDVTFGVVFGIFIVALFALIVIVLRWAIGRDREGRAAWRARQAGGGGTPNGDSPPPPGP